MCVMCDLVCGHSAVLAGTVEWMKKKAQEPLTKASSCNVRNKQRFDMQAENYA